MTSHKTLIDRIRTRVHTRHADERGLALLDVLIGMAIFALIAVIAVMGLGKFRQSAYLTAATEDARGFGLALETLSTDIGGYPASTDISVTAFDRDVPEEITTALASDFNHILTKGNHLGGYTYTAGTATTPASFVVCVEHLDPSKTGDAHAVYDSAKAGVTSTSKTEGCAASGYTFQLAPTP